MAGRIARSISRRCVSHPHASVSDYCWSRGCLLESALPFRSACTFVVCWRVLSLFRPPRSCDSARLIPGRAGVRHRLVGRVMGRACHWFLCVVGERRKGCDCHRSHGPPGSLPPHLIVARSAAKTRAKRSGSGGLLHSTRQEGSSPSKRDLSAVSGTAQAGMASRRRAFCLAAGRRCSAWTAASTHRSTSRARPAGRGFGRVWSPGRASCSRQSPPVCVADATGRPQGRLFPGLRRAALAQCNEHGP